MRAFNQREGAFSLYQGDEAEIVGYTTCAGCPGGNIEYAPEEMKKNGATVIHLATCFLVGYPPCPHIEYFTNYIEKKFDIPVIIGSHPIPKKYYETHTELGTWQDPKWEKHLRHVLGEETARSKYN
jgi:predicted metal-binding protein